MGHYDHEKAAKEDIINRPEITGKDDKAVKEPLKVSIAEEKTDHFEAVSDDLERATAETISETVEDIKSLIGMKPSDNFKILLSETLGGLFTALRSMSGKPWLRFAFAGGALGLSLIPHYLRYRASEKEKGTNV